MRGKRRTEVLDFLDERWRDHVRAQRSTSADGQMHECLGNVSNALVMNAAAPGTHQQARIGGAVREKLERLTPRGPIVRETGEKGERRGKPARRHGVTGSHFEVTARAHLG